MRRENLLFTIFLILIIIFIITISFITYHGNILNRTYISYGNSDMNCTVQETQLDENKIIDTYKNYNYLKIDKITSVDKISYDDLQDIIENTSENEFQYGIALLNNKIILLSEEINSNKIIDYDENSIDLYNLNNYLKEKNIDYTFNQINSLSIFSTESKFYQNDKFIDLHLENGFHIKDIEENKKELSSIINKTGNLLMSMNLDDGQYTYGIRTNDSTYINGYNILRHAGSTWSLILFYQQNPNPELKITIKSAIDYLLNNYIINYDEDISFVVEKKSSEIKLGGNALALLMLSEYSQIFNDNQYNEIAKRIANGILYMQQEDGTFYHILDLDGNVKETFRTVYYDGEAAFALLKYYQISNEPIYFEQVEKAINMFISNNYEQYRDHWISYAMGEFIKYNLDEKYIEFTLNNYTYNINKFDYNETFGPVRLELLLSTYKSYNYVLSNKPNSDAIKNFDISSLKESIEITLEVLFNYYISEEVAMYMKEPHKILSGFHDINSNFRMRIDDIQHSLIGLILYNNEFNI